MSTNQQKLDYLDGLRGLASAWVLIGHALMLTGWEIPVLGQPALAVDLFMMISGFLMYYHCTLRQGAEPIDRPRSWFIFWTRRFFRIAPVYYLALLAFMLIGPLLGEYREQIAALIPSMAQPPERYNDQSLDNILAHVSFIFGLSPYYHHRTALPDWSIGLEMQFYAAFPFILILMSRVGTIAGGIILCALAYLLWAIAPGYLHAFAMPGMLALKINLFVTGILIAAGLFCDPRQTWRFAVAAVIFAIIPLHHWEGSKLALYQIAMAGAFIALALHHRLPMVPGFVHRLLDMVSRQMGRGLLHFMGETSYSVYLLHLLIMIPVAGLIATQFGTDWAAPTRFAACVAVVIPVTYVLGWLIMHVIERPGIAMGKRLIKRMAQ